MSAQRRRGRHVKTGRVRQPGEASVARRDRSSVILACREICIIADDKLVATAGQIKKESRRKNRVHSVVGDKMGGGKAGQVRQQRREKYWPAVRKEQYNIKGQHTQTHVGHTKKMWSTIFAA